jgi:hypothetical protein
MLQQVDLMLRRWTMVEEVATTLPEVQEEVTARWSSTCLLRGWGCGYSNGEPQLKPRRSEGRRWEDKAWQIPNHCHVRTLSQYGSFREICRLGVQNAPSLFFFPLIGADCYSTWYSKHPHLNPPHINNCEPTLCPATQLENGEEKREDKEGYIVCSCNLKRNEKNHSTWNCRKERPFNDVNS